MSGSRRHPRSCMCCSRSGATTKPEMTTVASLASAVRCSSNGIICVAQPIIRIHIASQRFSRSFSIFHLRRRRTIVYDATSGGRAVAFGNRSGGWRLLVRPLAGCQTSSPESNKTARPVIDAVDVVHRETFGLWPKGVVVYGSVQSKIVFPPNDRFLLAGGTEGSSRPEGWEHWVSYPNPARNREAACSLRPRASRSSCARCMSDG